MLSDIEKGVFSVIDERKDEIVDYLRELIKYKTVAPSKGDVVDHDEYIKHQEFVSKTLEEMNCQIDMWEIDPKEMTDSPGAGVIIDRDCSRMPVLVGVLKNVGNGKSLILNGHYDVVPAGDEDSWSSQPFESKIIDNKIFGRGAADMKGGIAAMIQAVKSIQIAGIKLKGDIIFQIVPEEEVTEMGTLSACQCGYKADAAIIPEPTDMKVLIAMRGSMQGKITVYGRPGHAAFTQPHWKEGGAVNAITKAAKIISALEELTIEWSKEPDKRHKCLDPDIVLPTEIKGGDYWERYPEKVEIGFSANFLGKNVNIKEIEDKIMAVAQTDAWMKKYPPKIEYSWVYGTEISEDEPIVKIALDTLDDMGIDPQLTGWGTLSDAIHLVNQSNIPTISIGTDEGNIHGIDEFCDIDKLIDVTKAIAVSTMRWCGIKNKD